MEPIAQDFMTHFIKLCSQTLCLILLSVFASGQSVRAHNLPGSAQGALSETTEIATGMIVRSLKDDIRPMRTDGPSVQISTMGGSGGATGTTGFSATTGGVTPLTFGLNYRDVTTSRLDGGLTVGTVILGHQIDPALLIFGGVIAENGHFDTLYDSGHLSYSGAGLALGADYRLSDQVYLTAIIGGMSLDYDIARSAGSITGSFGARRQFLDLSGDYLTRLGQGSSGADLRFGFGLLYVKQTSDGYTESGGATVAGVTQDQTIATLELRSTWGQAGQYRPYLDAALWGKLSDDNALPVIVSGGSDAGWKARLALGTERKTARSEFDLGIGANFGDDSFEGLDAKLNYSLKF
jgi:hypothetical protein